MKNKKVVRLTESQLHNIIAKSVNKILKEGIPNYGERTRLAYGDNPEYVKNAADSIRSYWAEQGLTGDALERKVQEVLYNKNKFNKPQLQRGMFR